MGEKKEPRGLIKDYKKYETAWKRANLPVFVFQEGLGRAKEAQRILKGTTTENFPNLEKETTVQVQEGQRSPGRCHSTKSTPRHTVIRLSKVIGDEGILKEKKQITHTWVPGHRATDL